MSVCIDSGTVLANPVGTTSSPVVENSATPTASTTAPPASEPLEPPAVSVPAKSVTKLVSTTNSTGAVLQKVVNPVITVLNSSGPLTVVKSLCVTSGVSSAPQFTLVNSTPLSVANAVGKASTITLLNAPVTVVKAISAQQNVEKQEAVAPNTSAANSPPAIIENRGHNVFVKNTCPDSTVPDMPQSHKLLTASNFPQANVLTSVQNKTANGQRSKLKILSNVQMMPGTSQTVSNVILNKPNNNQRYVPRTKLIGANGTTTTKYINKPAPSNVLKPSMNTTAPPSIKNVQEKSPQRMVYPTHKSQIKTLPPNYVQKPPGIKTLSPQQKPVPGQVQRTNTGLRTIPPQRPNKVPNKPNYIGKHAIQAQKMRPSHKVRNVKVSANAPYYHNAPNPEKQLTFNQALTAEIIETLSNKSTAPNSYATSKHYEILPPRYDNAYTYQEHKTPTESSKATDDKTKLDALSLICQAVLLDHNYNATLPPDSPTRPVPPPIPQSQVNGMTGNAMYSPPGAKRRTLSSSNNISSTSTLSNTSIVPSNSSTMLSVADDDDAGSDVSDVSDRKHDTEGEETDTAPEAEAVAKEEQFEQFGDYVTRCICGFLHDDGYMVECDRCKVWQHVQCVVKNKQVPDEFFCEVCDPSKYVDKQKARSIQHQWLKDRQLMAQNKLKKDIKLKETLKQREIVSDTDSSDGEHAHNNNMVAKRSLACRRKSESKQPGNTSRTRRDSTNKDPTQQRRQKRRERKIVKRKVKPTKPPAASDDENQDNWSNPLPQLRQWIEKYEEAVTNHYSPELRARISNIRVNGAHADMPMQFDCTVQKCRVHTQPLTELKYIVSTVQLPPNAPIIELRGKYMLSTQHRNSGGSLTTRQHSQRPGPFLFFYRLHKDNTEVCVDTRTYGNSARFVRRSCKPNAELRHCIEKGVLHLYIVSIASIEKNCELTIKHESHDLAVIGSTQISCACGNPEDCAVNKAALKKNGEAADVHRKRRGRRTTSICVPGEGDVNVKAPKEEMLASPPIQSDPTPPEEDVPIKEEIKTEVKPDVEKEVPIKKEPVDGIKQEEVKQEIKDEPEEEKVVPAEIKEEEQVKSPAHTPIMTRRSSHYKSDKEDSRDGQEHVVLTAKEEKTKSKKLSREERKLEAILRAIEQMEKKDQRKQEHQAKAQHRRESEPSPNQKEDMEPKMKRRRRKGRSRAASTHTQNTRRNRLNSTDSYMTSGDETMLSPNDGPCSRPSLRDLNKSDQNDKDAGLLLALANGDNVKSHKSPSRDVDSNSNSTHSSPEAQLSSACLLVQAACEPLESGFKFPKTKKGLMNEWLNKVPEPPVQTTAVSPSSVAVAGGDYENSGFYSPAKNLAALAQAASYCDTNIQPRGNAKKRWLRQAISEDHSCDSPQSRPESPPISEMVAPPKKRRLPRESLSNEASPPLTPTSTAPPTVSRLENKPSQEGCVEIVFSGTEGDSPSQALESDALLKERAAQMKQEFTAKCVPEKPMACLLDPRLARDTHHHLFANSDLLVGTVEKTLSILGFQDRKPEAITPAKRKLSITEYLQRKKLNNNEKNEEVEPEPEPVSNEENNSSESFRATVRPRSGSTSSSTSITSSDEEAPATVANVDILQGKVLSAFNSEPTELERQRETSSLRLKKAFGLAVDDETRKPALNVEAILNCELPTVKAVKPPPSPTFPIPGSCEVTRDVPSPKSLPPSPPPMSPPPPPPPPPPPEEDEPEPMEVSTESVIVDQQVLAPSDDDIKPNMFYTPDEEEDESLKPMNTVYDPSGRFVPAFNNPAYSNNKLHLSSIDDDARYEGRNPSPPPNLEAGCD